MATNAVKASASSRWGSATACGTSTPETRLDSWYTPVIASSRSPPLGQPRVSRSPTDTPYLLARSPLTNTPPSRSSTWPDSIVRRSAVPSAAGSVIVADAWAASGPTRTGRSP